MKKTYLIFTLLLLSLSVLNAQDTLSGNYEDLVIVKGRHIISSMVIVSNSLKVDSGAKVEFIDNGTLVCGGLVEMLGNNRDILFATIMKWTNSYWHTVAIFYFLSGVFFGLYFFLSLNKKLKSKDQ